MKDSYCWNLPLGVARDVRPQYFGTGRSSAFVSVALAAVARVTGQRQLSPGANGDFRPKGVGGALPVERPVRICKQSLAKHDLKAGPGDSSRSRGRKCRTRTSVNDTI